MTLEDIAAEPLITYHLLHRPRAHRPRLRPAAPRAAHRAGGHRLRRHQDLRAPGPGHGHRRRDGRAGEADTDLALRPLGHLLGHNVARVAFKRGAYLRDFVYHFASLLSDRLDKALILKAMSGEASTYEL
jgi:LysR family cys regulon transcriptional activator